MRARKPRVFRTLAMLAVVLLSLAGCGVISIHGGMGYATPPILPDTPASALALNVVIEMSGAGPQGGKTNIIMQFYAHATGSRVQFAAGETLACAGAAAIPLKGKDGYVGQQYPTSAVAGHPYACTYTSKGRSAAFAFQMPAVPEILSPKNGATLSREQALPVTYTASTSSPIIVAYDGAQNHSDAQITVPGSATVDASFLSAGPGSIGIFEYPAPQVTEAGDFASLAVKCTSSAQVNVTWE